MFEPIIAPIAFALIMLGIAVFAVIRAVRRRMSGRNSASDPTYRTRHPDGWHEMPAHELLYGRGWHCISRMGFVEGDEMRPGVEFEVDPGTVGSKAKIYLREVLH